MGKYLILIVLGIIGVVIIVLLMKCAKENFRPLAMSPEEIEQELRQAIREALRDDDMVVVSMNNDMFHRPGCTKITGITEKITYEAALNRDLKPCPHCIGDGW